MAAKGELTQGEKDFVDSLFQGMAEGKVRLVSVTIRPCPRCMIDGKAVEQVHRPTPNWMNCFVCPECGTKTSR